MVREGEKWPAREKNEKGEGKKEENYIKKWGKGLKNASFWAINSKIRLAPPAANLCAGEKNESQKKGVGKKMIKMHNIYPCSVSDPNFYDSFFLT